MKEQPPAWWAELWHTLYEEVGTRPRISNVTSDDDPEANKLGYYGYMEVYINCPLPRPVTDEKFNELWDLDPLKEKLENLDSSEWEK